MPLIVFILSCVVLPLIACVIGFGIPIIVFAIIGHDDAMSGNLGPILSVVCALSGLLLSLIYMIRARLRAQPDFARQTTDPVERPVAEPPESEASSLATTEPAGSSPNQPLIATAPTRKVHWLIHLTGWSTLVFGGIIAAIAFFTSEGDVSCSNQEVVKLANQIYQKTHC